MFTELVTKHVPDLLIRLTVLTSVYTTWLSGFTIQASVFWLFICTSVCILHIVLCTVCGAFAVCTPFSFTLVWTGGLVIFKWLLEPETRKALWPYSFHIHPHGKTFPTPVELLNLLQSIMLTATQSVHTVKLAVWWLAWAPPNLIPAKFCIRQDFVGCHLTVEWNWTRGEVWTCKKERLCTSSFRKTDLHSRGR